MKILQFGRSMIEILGVLAIIAVLSIGGLLGYRRAVNNHQANTILDDVNRFAFVILERSGLALGEVIPKGDFVESGIYNLKGYQSEEAQGFSITVQSVPKGVCEALLPKAVLEYKVGIVTAGGSVDDEVIYDTLNTDLCQDTNDIAFYFGDTSNVCNAPDGNGPCTQNSDCCGGDFCAFENPVNRSNKSEGVCLSLDDYGTGTGEYTKTVNGQKWMRSSSQMTWWSAENWCKGRDMTLASRKSIGCGHILNGYYCTTSKAPGADSGGTAYENTILYLLQTTTPEWHAPSQWVNDWHWLEDYGNNGSAFDVRLFNSSISTTGRDALLYALCH